MSKKNESFAVFEIIEPQVFNRHLVVMLLGYLESDPGVCGELGFTQMINNISWIIDYLDADDNKDHDGILDIIDSETLLKILIRLMFGYIKQYRGKFDQLDESLFSDVGGIVEYLFCLDE